VLGGGWIERTPARRVQAPADVNMAV
jgi:hypothetical protein